MTSTLLEVKVAVGHLQSCHPDELLVLNLSQSSYKAANDILHQKVSMWQVGPTVATAQVHTRYEGP